MKYALIGCGRISPNHIEAAKNNHLEFVAMCDIVPKTMQEKSEWFDLEAVRKYTDYRELLEKEKPDLVAIATESGKQRRRGSTPAGRRALSSAPITRTVSINQYSICARPWRPDASAGSRTARRMSAGTGGRATMTRLRGAVPGRRTAAA